MYIYYYILLYNRCYNLGGIKIKNNERINIKRKIDEMNGLEFENYLHYVFLNLGYKVEMTPYSIDFGADLIIAKDNIKIVVQAKRHNSSVGVSGIQEILGAKGYYDANEALVVTTNKFTVNARKLAKKNNVKLWDRGILFQYIITGEELNNLKRKNKKKIRKKKKSFNKNIDIIIETIFNE